MSQLLKGSGNGLGQANFTTFFSASHQFFEAEASTQQKHDRDWKESRGLTAITRTAKKN